MPCSETRSPSPGATALGLTKSTTATLSVRKRQKCKQFPTIEGPVYCHPAYLVVPVAEYCLDLKDYEYRAYLTLVE